MFKRHQQWDICHIRWHADSQYKDVRDDLVPSSAVLIGEFSAMFTDGLSSDIFMAMNLLLLISKSSSPNGPPHGADFWLLVLLSTQTLASSTAPEGVILVCITVAADITPYLFLPGLPYQDKLSACTTYMWAEERDENMQQNSAANQHCRIELNMLLIITGMIVPLMQLRKNLSLWWEVKMVQLQRKKVVKRRKDRRKLNYPLLKKFW